MIISQSLEQSGHLVIPVDLTIGLKQYLSHFFRMTFGVIHRKTRAHTWQGGAVADLRRYKSIRAVISATSNAGVLLKITNIGF